MGSYKITSTSNEDELLQWFLDHEFTVVSPEEQQRFTLALGRMIQVWTDLETTLHLALRHYSKVSPEIARAIFSGVRARVVCEYLSNIAHNTNMDPQRAADLERVLQHIKAMNTMRDWLTHNASASLIVTSERAAAKRVLTNKDRASRVGKEFSVMIDAQLVEDLNSDIVAASFCLHPHFQRGPFAQAIDGSTGKSYVWKFRPPQSKPGNKSSSLKSSGKQ